MAPVRHAPLRLEPAPPVRAGRQRTNDVAMVLFVLLAIGALVSGPRLLVFPLFGAAVLTKALAVALGGLSRWASAGQRAPGGTRRSGYSEAVQSRWRSRCCYAPFWEERERCTSSRGGTGLPPRPDDAPRVLPSNAGVGRRRTPCRHSGGVGFSLYVLARVGWWWSSSRGVPIAGPLWEGWLGAARRHSPT